MGRLQIPTVRKNLANSAAAKPTQNGNSCDDANTIDSANSAYDIPGNEDPNGVPKKGEK